MKLAYCFIVFCSIFSQFSFAGTLHDAIRSGDPRAVRNVLSEAKEGYSSLLLEEDDQGLTPFKLAKSLRTKEEDSREIFSLIKNARRQLKAEAKQEKQKESLAKKFATRLSGELQDKLEERKAIENINRGLFPGSSSSPRSSAKNTSKPTAPIRNKPSGSRVSLPRIAFSSLRPRKTGIDPANFEFEALLERIALELNSESIQDYLRQSTGILSKLNQADGQKKIRLRLNGTEKYSKALEKWVKSGVNCSSKSLEQQIALGQLSIEEDSDQIDGSVHSCEEAVVHLIKVMEGALSQSQELRFLFNQLEDMIYHSLKERLDLREKDNFDKMVFELKSAISDESVFSAELSKPSRRKLFNAVSYLIQNEEPGMSKLIKNVNKFIQAQKEFKHEKEELLKSDDLNPEVRDTLSTEISRIKKHLRLAREVKSNAKLLRGSAKSNLDSHEAAKSLKTQELRKVLMTELAEFKTLAIRELISEIFLFYRERDQSSDAPKQTFPLFSREELHLLVSLQRYLTSNTFVEQVKRDLKSRHDRGDLLGIKEANHNFSEEYARVFAKEKTLSVLSFYFGLMHIRDLTIGDDLTVNPKLAGSLSAAVLFSKFTGQADDDQPATKRFIKFIRFGILFSRGIESDEDKVMSQLTMLSCSEMKTRKNAFEAQNGLNDIYSLIRKIDY
jgi:hypothetical protein